MPIATPKQFAQMLDAAQAGGYAYPAINCTSIITLNAAMKGFADQKSDGIIQFSTGAGQFASGLNNADKIFGCMVLAEAAHRLAEQYDVLIALNTDHCSPGMEDEEVKQWLQAEAQSVGCEVLVDGKIPAALANKHDWLKKDKKEQPEDGMFAPSISTGKSIDDFLKTLIEETAKRRANGQPNLFQNHMLDASILPLKLNMEISKRYHALCQKNEIILEVEAGVVGGEEDGAAGSEDTPEEDLYTTPEDMLAVHEALSGIGRFTFAATFGNVHGHYKPGAVKLRPEILKQGQAVVTEKHGAEAELDLVFHGGSGSSLEEIRETLDYGVVKMNVDTDTQYAFTRPIVRHMCENIEGVLKIDREVGNKKVYDPRSYLKAGEKNMAARVAIACDDLLSSGKSVFGDV